MLRSTFLLVGAALLGGCAISQNRSVKSATPATTQSAVTSSSVALDVPKLSPFAADKLSPDLLSSGFAINALATADGFEPQPDIFNAKIRLGWNDQGVIVGVIVHEPVLVEAENINELWKADAVELVFAPSSGSSELVQVLVAPGLDGKHDAVRTLVADRRKKSAATPVHVLTAREKTADGYILEMLLPWDTFGITPQLGQTVALQATVDSHAHEADGFNAQARLAWYPSLASYRDSKLAYVIRLSDHASPPVEMAASAGYERFRHLNIDVVTDGALAGQTIQGRLADGTTASATIAEGDGPAITPLQFPLPAPRVRSLTTQPVALSESPSMATVKAGDQSITLPVFSDLDETRVFGYWHERLSARNFVFTTDDFPPIDFERPSEVEDLIGPYRLKTTFYDSDFKPVLIAKRPGRYGAVVEVMNGTQLVERRYVTLYRAAKTFEWRGAFDAVSAKLPKETGLDENILAEQQPEMSTILRAALGGSLSRDSSLAVLFAGLSEAKAGDVGPQSENFARRNDAWWIALKKSIGQFQPYQTVVHLPPGYQRGSGTHWPLILFLHGSDPHSAELSFIKSQGLCLYAIQHPELPFIVISPNSPPTERFSPATLSTILDEAMKQYDVDPDRVYLTGLSLGGMGTWDLAAEMPDRFAAAAPIAGYGDPNDAARLVNLPLWSFHGDADPTVPIEADRQCIDALRAIGGRVKFTVYPGVGHNSWTQTYADPELYKWFMQQRRGAPTQQPYPLFGATTRGTRSTP